MLLLCDALSDRFGLTYFNAMHAQVASILQQLAVQLELLTHSERELRSQNEDLQRELEQLQMQAQFLVRDWQCSRSCFWWFVRHRFISETTTCCGVLWLTG